MVMAENYPAKNLHKIVLICIKYLPFVIGILYFLNTVLSYFNIDWYWITLVSGTSLLSILFMLLCSFAFKFCLYHRLPIYYILLNNIINWIDYKYRIPITNKNMFCLYIVITGITVFLMVFVYVKHNKRAVRKHNR